MGLPSSPPGPPSLLQDLQLPPGRILGRGAPVPCAVSHLVTLSLGISGCEVFYGPWGAPTECSVAHGGHSVTGEAFVEGPPQRGLEGQDVLPLVPAAPAPSGLHQVGSLPLLRD